MCSARFSAMARVLLKVTRPVLLSHRELFMTSAIRIAVAAALSFTSITLAHAQSADVEKRQVVALADTSAVHWSDVAEITDRFAGRYVAADGEAFSITLADDELTLEAPESWGPSLLT